MDTQTTENSKMKIHSMILQKRQAQLLWCYCNTTRKHKDRTDDIPNCPSIEDIIDMPVPNEIPPSDKTETSNVRTDLLISNAKLLNGTMQSQATSTPQENSTKSMGHETSIVPKRFHRNYRKRQRHSWKSSRRHRSNIDSSTSKLVPKM